MVSKEQLEFMHKIQNNFLAVEVLDLLNDLYLIGVDNGKGGCCDFKTALEDTIREFNSLNKSVYQGDKTKSENVNKITPANKIKYETVDFKTVAIAYINEDISVNEEDDYIIISTNTREIWDFGDITLNEVNDDGFIVLKKVKY